MLRWNVGCGAELRERLLWRGEAEGTSFTSVDCTRLPDGTAVAVCGTYDGWFQVRDLAAGTLLGGPSPDLPGVFERHPRRLVCTALPDGTPVAVTAGQDDTLRVWDLVTGRMRAATHIDEPESSLTCTLLPDGTPIAVTSGSDRVVRFWDLAAARPYGSPLICAEPRPAVACAAPVDGTALLVVADGATLKVWDLGEGRFRGAPIETGFFSVWNVAGLRLADGTVLAVAGSGREWSEAIGSRHGVVRAWDVSTGRPYGPPLICLGGEITDLACTELPDGTPVAVAVSRYGTVHSLNLRTGLLHGPSLPHIGDSPDVACARLPDGTPVVVAAEDELQVWSLNVRPSPQGLAGPIWMLGQADDVLLTAGHEDRVGYTVQLWDSRTGRPRGRMLAGAARRAKGCLRTRDGAAVVAVTPDGSGLDLWDLGSDTAREVTLAGHTPPVHVIACLNLRDGTPIVITGGASVRAWRADTGEPYGPPIPARIAWHADVSCLQLPDETLLVVAPHGGEVQAWDAATGDTYGVPTVNWSGRSGALDCLTLLDGTSMAVRAVVATHRKPSVVGAWNLATGRRKDRIDLRVSRPNAIACTQLPDGAVIAAVGGSQGRNADDLVEIVDPVGGRKRHEIVVPEVMDLGFTPEHRLIVRSYLDVAVYDLP